MENASVKNILIVRNDRLGEFLLTVPAIIGLKETFVNAKIIAVINSRVCELAECIPHIDETLVFDKQKRSLREILDFVKLLKTKKINIAIMFNPSKEFNIITFLAGIKTRVGYNKKCGFLLNRKLRDDKHLRGRHEIEYNFELTGLLGVKYQKKEFSNFLDDRRIDEALKDFGSDIGEKFIAVHPFTSDDIKQWPLEKFAELTARITSECGLKTIVVGGREWLTKSQEVFGNIRGDFLNLTGKTNLKELAAILKRARVLITGDSGPMHLACALGTPVIALFRNDITGKQATRWGPRGNGHAVIEKDSLEKIKIEEVLEKIKERIGKT